MAKDEWTTGEVENWLLNDEAMYRQCMDLANRARLYSRRWLMARLRKECTEWARGGKMGELNVTAMRRVDWEIVAETIAVTHNERSKEESNG